MSTRHPRDPLAELSTRERQVLELVGAGHSNQEIGLKLGLAEKTIKHYMTNILTKLQVRSRVEAALLAARAPSVLPVPKLAESPRMGLVFGPRSHAPEAKVPIGRPNETRAWIVMQYVRPAAVPSRRNQQRCSAKGGSFEEANCFSFALVTSAAALSLAVGAPAAFADGGHGGHGGGSGRGSDDSGQNGACARDGNHGARSSEPAPPRRQRQRRQ